MLVTYQQHSGIKHVIFLYILKYSFKKNIKMIEFRLLNCYIVLIKESKVIE